MAKAKPAATLTPAPTPALKRIIDDITKRVDDLTESNVRGRWEIGKKLNDVINDNTGAYGSEPRKMIETMMPLSRDSLRPMMVFASTYSDTDVDKFLAHKHPQTGERLTWSHMAVLTRVRDKGRAMALADKAAKGGWSTKVLNAEVIRLQGGAKSRGGRKVRKPTNLHAALADIRTRTQTWMNAAAESWMPATGGGVTKMYKAAYASSVPPLEVVTELDNVVEMLDKLIAQARAVTVDINGLALQAKAARTTRTPVA